MSNVGNNRGNWRNSEVVRRPSNGRIDYRGNYENCRQGNQWFESRNRFQKDDRRFNDRDINLETEVDQRLFWTDRKSLAIPDSQIDKVVKVIEEEKVEIYLSKTKLKEKQKQELRELFNSFQGLFSDKNRGLHMFYIMRLTREITHRWFPDRGKQKILDYHVDKMVKEGTIIPIQSPYASPVVLCKKNNGLPLDNPEAYRFAVDYRKLNSIKKYPRYPLPLIDDLIMNIPHPGIMSALDLTSGYFHMAVNPSDIVKTAFVTKIGTYAFR
ncbi:retrovirus-related Pol polyprotein from transposon 297 [Trichonephila clavipes]|nr:retrovirus-related Pol polyprotein from transposon 297 [Trichonephila clavipes]